jgi:hypothetical protein
MPRILTIVLALALVNAAAADDHVEFFEKRIRPLLAENCYSCHSATAKKLKGGLKLDSRAAALKGGDNGPALVPGAPEKSRLIEAVHYKNVDLMMPPKAKLPDTAIADLAKWIKDGAVWPSGAAAKVDDKSYAFDLAKRKREHWAWQPIKSGGLPTPAAIDQLLNANLKEKNLIPAPAAEPRVILRRLSFDLVGLPPPPEMVVEFEKAYAANPKRAIAAAADEFMASPHFGERWARHWLDLVRYAESRGHEFDYNLPNAYQYRDYVIRALNENVPYDQFVREHIAGDLLPKPRLHLKEGYNESILGTGFWYLGEQVHSPVDICQDRADRVDNQIDVFSKAFLGLTVACARCHDHKFDAISTKDYYALAGFLESSNYRLVPFETMEHNRKFAAVIWKHLDEFRLKYTKSFAARDQAKLADLEDYLEEARAVLQKNKSTVTPEKKETMDANRVGRWVNHLKASANDRRDPFHNYARVILGLPESPVSRAEKLNVIVDYANCSPEMWLSDGFAFGPGPVPAGALFVATSTTESNRSVQIGGTHGGPFATETAAVFDPGWANLKATGADNEPGAVGRMIRAGRTLRSPKFEIDEGKIHCRVRGAGMIYVAVEGHIMLAGPLHNRLVQTFKVGPEFRWHTIDLSVYKGRRVHLEFTPEGKDFALARVAQSVTIPDEHELDAPAEISEWEGAKKPVALPQHASRLRSHFAVAFAAVARGTPTPIEVHRVNWFWRHPDLFVESKSDSRQLVSADSYMRETIADVEKELRLDSKLAPAIMDGSAVDEHVFIRGNYKTPGEVVPRRFLEALAGPGPIKSDYGSGRLQLARQVTDPALNPFFTRVFVNRVWHHMFGRGLVASVDNFGVLGDTPTHPELLDALADQFAKDGYSVKALIRRMVLSDAYQRSSRPSEAAAKIDPANLLLQHARVRRLEGEAIRDAFLSVSGRLDPKLYGPSAPVHLTDFQQGRGRPASGPIDGNGRRSIYLSVRRNFLSPLLLAFDTPIPFSTVGRRTVSNVPAQALILLNDPFVHQQAGLWAKRVLAEAETFDDRLSRMYLAAYGRTPAPSEAAACREFIGGSDAAWVNLAHALFNAKEFIFLE